MCVGAHFNAARVPRILLLILVLFLLLLLTLAKRHTRTRQTDVNFIENRIFYVGVDVVADPDVDVDMDMDAGRQTFLAGQFNQDIILCVT